MMDVAVTGQRANKRAVRLRYTADQRADTTQTYVAGPRDRALDECADPPVRSPLNRDYFHSAADPGVVRAFGPLAPTGRRGAGRSRAITGQPVCRASHAPSSSPPYGTRARFLQASTRSPPEAARANPCRQNIACAMLRSRSHTREAPAPPSDTPIRDGDQSMTETIRRGGKRDRRARQFSSPRKAA